MIYSIILSKLYNKIDYTLSVGTRQVEIVEKIYSS